MIDFLGRYDSKYQRRGSMVLNGLLEVAWKNGVDSYKMCSKCEKKFFGSMTAVADLLRLEIWGHSHGY